MFESTREPNGINDTGKAPSNRESLPGPGLVQRARESLINRNDNPTHSNSSTAAEKYRRDLQSQYVLIIGFLDYHLFRAAFPDPPSYAQQRQPYHEPDVFGDRDAKPIALDVRSQSEYKMGTPKVGLGARAVSSPDETDLYSEITVCMSQVISSLRLL